MAAKLFNRYIWLIDTIYAAGHITLNELNQRWANSTLNDNRETRIPRNTFLKWRHDIEEIFHLDIECDKATNSYYIANVDNLKYGLTCKWLLNAFAVSHFVSDCQDIMEFIVLEDIPSDTRFLTTIMAAIREKRILNISYQRFDAAAPHTMTLQAYCIKVFKQRWYVAGKSSDHPAEIRVYALDRVHTVSMSDSHYEIPSDFDAKRFFRDYYGIFRGDSDSTQRVLIKINSQGAPYLRSLPLHSSQNEIERTNTYSIFEYHIVPTFDFIQELRTHGAGLEVLAPQSLVDNFRHLAEEYHRLYSKPTNGNNR